MLAKRGRMKKLNKLEKENFTTYHFMLLGYANFKGIKKKLDSHLKYYRLEYVGKYNAKEITYDVADNMLSNHLGSYDPISTDFSLCQVPEP